MIFAPTIAPWRTLAALMLEAAIGYPEALHQILPHPITRAGRAIHALEQRWNHPDQPAARRRLLGIAVLLLVAGGAALIGFLIDQGGRDNIWAALATLVLATTGLAQRSLYTHVAAVRAALQAGNLPAARLATGRIVGRDTATLDINGVATAALESLAESFCDGIIAPAFWFFLLGLGGLFAYKAINTADSMIGHREPRWRDFGWAAARTDDFANLIPARLSGALLALAAGGGWRVMLRDARLHDSPNAGWPEAAMAGGLKIRLGGPVTYDGAPHPRPWFGDGATPDTADLTRGLRVYLVACGLFWILLAAGGCAWRH
ncbi:cobalamin biosynthesis protein CobD [Acidocella aquatica]|uniref:Cobalamin biosynthesis protein CobD n=1 Tax=Acidocella aquatica TaxID=1922313 RepID=A0ABQ5ZYS6_9PROT|nr:adenosylcobinamide-phosphate synthase CbiB [Acidocella aquatica]GLR65365.1 cobalamin biosynthesis protein CobD [Acidocella aquatica]